MNKMSEKYSRNYKKTPKRNREETSRSKRSKNSYEHQNKYEKESKTPPLPKKRHSIEELIKQRESLKVELQQLEKNKDSRSKSNYRDSRKRKSSQDTNNKLLESTKAKNSKTNHEKSRPKTNLKLSPEYTEDHLDSEDEENIIEQRRKQRKQLLEKFNDPQTHKEPKIIDAVNMNSVSPKKRSNETVKGNTSKKDTESVNKSSSDMFSEKDDFVQQNNLADDKKDQTNLQLSDNWDNSEGYYNIVIGDTLKNRYVIKDILGQGVFANVVRVQDNSQNNEHFAIKIVRNNELMYKTSLKEISILKEINEADLENKYHCVKFYGNFMHKGHLCLVLESLHMDLRGVLKKYGKNHGIHLKALISYTRQLLMALRLLNKIGVIHADIKPDNILVNEKKNILKLCDFGSASKVDENEITPYLVSRFYRAPEIILGISYNHGIDIWSTACTIFEMATGKILFTGNSNNKMLKCFMDLKGRVPAKLIKKGKFKDQHFNYNNNFLLHKKDEFTGRDKVVEISNHIATRDLYKDLHKASKNMTPGEEKKLTQLKDLLEKMLMLDSNHRLTVSDCLKHSFIQEELDKK